MLEHTQINSLAAVDVNTIKRSPTLIYNADIEDKFWKN